MEGDPGESKIKSKFLIPNTLNKKPMGDKFNIRVYQNKVARVTPYSGSLTIEAKMEKLEEAEINRWWDEIYSKLF